MAKLAMKEGRRMPPQLPPNGPMAAQKTPASKPSATSQTQKKALSSSSKDKIGE